MSRNTVMITHDSDGYARVKLSDMGGLCEARRDDPTKNEKTATLFDAIMAISGVTDVFAHADIVESSDFVLVIVISWSGGDEAAAKAFDKALWLRILRAISFAWRVPSSS